MTEPKMNSTIHAEQDFIRSMLRLTETDTLQGAQEAIVRGYIGFSKPPGANSRQVGGSHYEAELQHWDVIESYGVGYIEGCSSKYVTRARKKNGLQDVEKTIHYIEKLLEIRRPPRGSVPIEVCLAFNEANKLTPLEGAICTILFTWTTFSQLETALQLTRDLRDLIANAPPLPSKAAV